MKRTRLRSKDLNEELKIYGISFDKKESLELLEEEKNKIVFVNKSPAFFYVGDKLIPTLKYILQNPQTLKQITVDAGAIKFIVNGADVMRPGIKDIQEGIHKEEIIVIVDENHKKPLAVGLALFSGEEMKQAVKGKVVKNLHYVGDGVWKVE